VLGRIVQVLRDRRQKQAMAEASYWDARARSRSGFARSVWHSENFSRVWDARQRELLRAALGSLAGKRVADVGCGTGRITRFLASEGAQATGFDFSPATVEAANEETQSSGAASSGGPAAPGVSASFVVANVVSGELPAEPGSFDAVLAVGCLAVACRDLLSLERALWAMAKITRPGGQVVLLEPIHESKLLGRVLRAKVSDWVRAGEAAGLSLEQQRGMGFVPARLALSSLDLPAWLVSPAFAAGELALEQAGWIERAADYRLLCFRRPA
jgi:SAM-dependent methyltransferase